MTSKINKIVDPKMIAMLIKTLVKTTFKLMVTLKMMMLLIKMVVKTMDKLIKSPRMMKVPRVMKLNL